MTIVAITMIVTIEVIIPAIIATVIIVVSPLIMVPIVNSLAKISPIVMTTSLRPIVVAGARIARVNYLGRGVNHLGRWIVHLGNYRMVIRR
jgi:hypothetical protein